MPARGGRLKKKIEKWGGEKKSLKIRQGKKSLKLFANESDNLQWMDDSLSLSYNCSLTMCGPLGVSVCNIWPSR